MPQKKNPKSVRLLFGSCGNGTRTLMYVTYQTMKRVSGITSEMYMAHDVPSSIDVPKTVYHCVGQLYHATMESGFVVTSTYYHDDFGCDGYVVGTLYIYHESFSKHWHTRPFCDRVMRHEAWVVLV